MLTITKPKKMNTLAKLAEFEAILDKHLFDTRPDGEDENPDLNKKGIGRKVAGVGAGVGAVYGGKKLAKHYGADQVEGLGNQIKTVGRGLGRDASEAGENAIGSAAGFVKKKAPGVSGAVEKAWTRSAGKGIGERVGRAVMSGAKNLVHAEANIGARIIALDAISDKIIELRRNR